MSAAPDTYNRAPTRGAGPTCHSKPAASGARLFCPKTCLVQHLALLVPRSRLCGRWCRAWAGCRMRRGAPSPTTAALRTHTASSTGTSSRHSWTWGQRYEQCRTMRAWALSPSGRRNALLHARRDLVHRDLVTETLCTETCTEGRWLRTTSWGTEQSVDGMVGLALHDLDRAAFDRPYHIEPHADGSKCLPCSGTPLPPPCCRDCRTPRVWPRWWVPRRRWRRSRGGWRTWQGPCTEEQAMAMAGPCLNPTICCCGSAVLLTS